MFDVVMRIHFSGLVLDTQYFVTNTFVYTIFDLSMQTKPILILSSV